MDTDDLAKKTYTGILTEAEKYNHDLTVQFGMLASHCKDDDDYLNKAEIVIIQWLNVENFEDIVYSVFYGESVDYVKFKKTLEKILTNIAEIRKTPMDKREYENWG